MARTTAPPAHTTLAYLRVSTLDQDIEKNKADILRFANQHDLGRVRFVEEIASGRTPWRERRIAEVLEALGANDALIVAELSRLGRSMLECMEILALATRKGIRVYSVKGELAPRSEPPEQDHRAGVLDGGGDRAGLDFTAHERGLALQESPGTEARPAQGTGQEQAGCLSAGDREPAGKRFDTEIHRAALSHHRGQSAQLAQEAWLEDRQVEHAHLKCYGTFVSFV